MEVGSKMITSFLQARDKSILAWNRADRAALKNVKVNLEDIIDDSSEDTTIQSTQGSQEESKCIRVYLRLKGDVPYEKLYQINGNCLICKVPEGSYSTRNLKYGDAMTRTYTFTRVFDSNTTQLGIFNDIVKARLLGFINGRNSTIFTYGASGAGKTFTIVGTPDEPGLIPRALEYIFRTLTDLDDKPKVKPYNGSTQDLDANSLCKEKHNKSMVLNATLIDKSVHVRTYRQMQDRLSSEPVAEIEKMTDVSASIWISFAEIYNENIHDLLVQTPRGKPKPKLDLGYSKDQVYIKNLTSINVSNGLEAYQILQFGIHNLRYASTSVNSHSSRSHSIFTIQLVQTSSTSDDVHISSFNFCDLAGSERMKKTNNIGERLKESNNINTSLLVLGRCIENIKCMQQMGDSRLIPFRESKLTQLFKRSLLGYENMEMIVNINPSREMFDESHHSLNFSAIAKEIVVEEQAKKVIQRKNRFSLLMENSRKNLESDVCVNSADKVESDKLKQMVSDLYNEIEHLKYEHQKEIDEEKLYVSNLYKKYYEDKIARLEVEKLEEIERLKEKHQLELEMLKTADDSIINISSSSNECGTPIKSSDSLHDKLAALHNRMSEMKEEHLLVESQLKATIEKLKSDNSRLREECLKLKQESQDKEDLLQEAKTAYNEMQDEITELKYNNKELRVRNIILEEERDRSEQFTIAAFQNTCDDRDSNCSDGEETISQAQNESTFSQSRIKDEDKKFF